MCEYLDCKEKEFAKVNIEDEEFNYCEKHWSHIKDSFDKKDTKVLFKHCKGYGCDNLIPKDLKHPMCYICHQRQERSMGNGNQIQRFYNKTNQRT